jgi:hypothetical protein
MDAKYWRDRAAKSLIEASELHDEWAREQLIKMALVYEHLARRAEIDTDPSTDDDEIAIPLRDIPVSRPS